MKKIAIIGILGVAAALTACSNQNKEDVKTVFVNGKYFGQTVDKGYENGQMLYSKNGDYAGFIDVDNIVYKGRPGRCGGEFVGLCENINNNNCNVSNYAPETTYTDENGGGSITLSQPFRFLECGQKL
jgi:hypothetical protein